MALSREELLQARRFRLKPLVLEGLGDVYVREVNGSRRDYATAFLAEHKAKNQLEVVNGTWQLLICCLCLCDAQGAYLFDPEKAEDKSALQECLSREDIRRICSEGMMLSGFAPEARERETKNSESLSQGSGSGSPATLDAQ